MAVSKFNELYLKINQEFQINPDEIIYCRGDGSYTDIILTNGKKHKICHNLKCLTSLLPAKKFYRCHHSYLINVDEIKGFDVISKKLILDGGKSIPISRRKFFSITCKVKTFTKQKIINQIGEHNFCLARQLQKKI